MVTRLLGGVTSPVKYFFMGAMPELMSSRDLSFCGIRAVSYTHLDVYKRQLAGFIAMAIADRPGLMVGFVGGALANTGLCFQNGQFVDRSTAGASVVSAGFLGALIAGFLAGFLMKGLEKLFSKLPDSLEGIKPVLLYPFFGLLIIAALMIFVVNPPLSALNAVSYTHLHAAG